MGQVIKLLILGLLAVHTHGKLTITDLGQTKIYAENLGTAQVYHEEWKLITSFDVTGLRTKYTEIRDIYDNTDKNCNKKCLENHELEMTRTHIKRTYEKLQNMEYTARVNTQTRRRRGIIDGIGSLSKSLFGTLDEADLTAINKEIDRLYDHQNQMSQAIVNQTHIIKILLNTASQDYNKNHLQSEKNLKLIGKVKDNERNIYIENQIAILSIMLIEINEDINTVTMAIAEGKHGIVHPQMLPPTTLVDGIKALEKQNNIKYTIQAELGNYQEIIDISKLTVTLSKGKIIFILDLPLTEHNTYTVTRLIPIPFRHGQTFIAIIPESEILLQEENKGSYIPADFHYLETKCRQHGSRRICERTQPTLLAAEVSSCDNQILRKQEKSLNHRKCITSIFNVNTLVYISLIREKGYIVIPEHETTFNTMCGTTHSELKITNATLIRSDRDCTLFSDSSSIKLQHSDTLNQDIRYPKSFNLSIPAEELDTISKEFTPLQHHVDFNELREMGKNLDDIQDHINILKTSRRTKTWTEHAYSGLQYLGYTAITVLTIWGLNKAGLFKALSNCFPRCLKICLIKNKINNVHSASAPPPNYSMVNTHMPDETTSFVGIKRLRPKLPGVSSI